jgi:hypothetical protein
VIDSPTVATRIVNEVKGVNRVDAAHIIRSQMAAAITAFDVSEFHKDVRRLRSRQVLTVSRITPPRVTRGRPPSGKNGT